MPDNETCGACGHESTHDWPEPVANHDESVKYLVMQCGLCDCTDKDRDLAAARAENQERERIEELEVTVRNQADYIEGQLAEARRLADSFAAKWADYETTIEELTRRSKW